MKLFWSILLLIPVVVHGRHTTGSLPEHAVAVLDSLHHRWSLVDNFAIIQQPLFQGIELDTSECHPNLVWGDFDGDSLLDYAALIEFKSEAGKRRRGIAALLSRGKTYEHHFLPGGSDFIWIAKKGSTRYDYDTGDYFQMKNDGIDDVIIEKAATTFIFENGKFKEIITAD